MIRKHKTSRPVIGVLPGWQVFWVSLQLFLEPMLRGIHTAAHDFDCDLLIACRLNAEAIKNDYLPVSVENTDGLIIITNPPDTNMPQLQEYFDELITTSHPLVSIGFSQAKIQILPDNFQGVYQGLQHLYAHGHRQIAYIAGFEESPKNTDSYERHAAYEQFLRDYGLVYDPRLVVYGDHAIGKGRDATTELLERQVSFTAIFASNDKSAIGAAEVLHQHHVRIPQDVALIGFDNDLMAGTAQPPLTTTQLPAFDMGYHAVEQLLALWTTPHITPKTIRVVGPLVMRESCGCTHQHYLEHSVSPASNTPEPTLIQRLYSAVVTETHHMRSDQLQHFCRELVTAYQLSQQQQTAQAFQTTLATILHEVAKIGDDMSVWQTAITLLEQNAHQTADTTFNVFSSQLLMQARLLVAQRAGYEYSRSVVRHNEMTDYLSRLNAHLHTALTLADILQVLVANLDVLRIVTMHLALFEPDNRHPMAWCRIFTLTAKGYIEHPELVETRFFPPPTLFDMHTYHLALVPLIVENRQIGFVIFAADNLELCGSITWQIAAALRGSQLYQQAAQDRQIAEEANRLKSRFLAMVSHELRTPIGLMTNLSELLLRESYDNSTTENYLQKIAANARHLNSLIGDVLDLASTEMGQLRLSWDTVDLHQVFDAVARAGEQLTQDKGLAWEYAVPTTLPLVRGDATRLRQVALNLVANAVKFTEVGSVRFVARVENQLIKVSISDTGIGIPPAEQQLIFDEFQKSERTSIRAYGGMGLGLAICNRLIELHQGNIGVISSGKEGEGSTFYFTLPILETVPDPATATGDTILLLTEAENGQDTIASHLQDRNFAVVQHRFQEDIASIIHQVQPNAIILNSHAANTRGWEVLRDIRGNQHAQTAPVLFHTPDNDNALLLELDYLPKPLQSDELTQALYRQGWDKNASSTKTILIVDDDPGIREMHARILYDWSPDYALILASNGREALTHLHHIHPDLILLDLMMPEMDGFKLLEHLREMQSTRHIPVIVITAHTLNSEEMARLNRGVATVLSKGMFTAAETLVQIEHALMRNRKMGTETQQLVRRAMAFIHTHYAEPLAREDIARHVSVSEDYLTRCFKQETGISPIAYLNRYRVNQAKRLLEDSPMSMSEIAVTVGFTDNMHFSRAFRRESGMTPSEYRAKYR